LGFSEDLLKPKLERRSSEESLTFDFSSIKREGNSSPISSGGTSGTGTLNMSGEGVGGGGGMAEGLQGTPSPMNKPPVMRRRIRRRANSNSQDPAEQLTEMSVRGRCPYKIR